jgi:hypothetical protein
MRRIFLYLPLIIGLFACERMLMESQPAADPEDVFLSMWTTLDEKYSFFEEKNINWDIVKDTVIAKIHPEMSNLALFDLLAETLYILRDGHTNLRSEFDLSRNWRWFLDHPDNFSADLVARNYLGENARISGSLRHQVIDSVLYIQCLSFGASFSGNNFQSVLNRADSCKGVIIDVRHNGGGFLSLARFLASGFIREEQDVYSVQERMSSARNDFSPAQVFRLAPHPNAYKKGPVIVLTNRRSYSASTYFAAMMKYNSHVTIMGDTTGGGGGTPIDAELPNGWQYRFSATRAFDRMGLSLEPGVAPDVVVSTTQVSEAMGIDDIIEAALERLR